MGRRRENVVALVEGVVTVLVELEVMLIVFTVVWYLLNCFRCTRFYLKY